MAKREKVKTFVVKRSKWLRGGKGTMSGSCLRASNGKQCCLGFIGRQVGIKAKDLEDRILPWQLRNDLLALYPILKNDGWSGFAYINDDEDITDKEREKRLKALARQHGFRFKFVD